MANRQIVLLFDEEKNLDPAVRGGKGQGLAEMTALGLPLPPGFTISTGAARAYSQTGEFPKRVRWQLERGLAALEQSTGKKFGDNQNPLLVSVRSGAKVSMPGMLDTVLNLGLTYDAVRNLAETRGKRFAYDVWRRFLAMYGEVVLGVDHAKFETALRDAKSVSGARSDQELSGRILKSVCESHRAQIEITSGKRIPDDPREQLCQAITAVFQSWDSPRAASYRAAEGIPSWWGTAVNVQAMVFGNLGEDSCTGVTFSHNVSTGVSGLFGEFLVNAQGEDVVSGTRKPLPIAEMRNWNPALYAELEAHVRRLEERYNDAVDVEFTVERGKLFILQCRVAKRTPEAAVVIAVHQVWAKKWSREEALQKVSSEAMDKACEDTRLDPSALNRKVQEERCGYAEGLAVSPGAIVGKAVFSARRAIELVKAGERVVLIRPDTTPDDLAGMLVAKAIATANGGITCHAAVVARGLGIPCVVSLKGLQCGADSAKLASGQIIREGDLVSMDGAMGVLVLGEIPVIGSADRKEINIFFRWAKCEKPIARLPKPRINFAAREERRSANQMLNDFYLSQAIALATKRTVLEREVARVWNRVQVEIAEAFACYLLLAVSAELRHTSAGCNAYVTLHGHPETYPVEYRALQKQFGVQDNNATREEAQRSVIGVLEKTGANEQIQFFRLAKVVFCNYAWPPHIGGPKWGAIAKAGLDFLSGTLSHALFVDHVFDLQHNGGRLFDKHAMLTARTNEGTLRYQLEAKKAATGLEPLFSKLNCHSTFSPEISAVWERGLEIGIGN